MSTVLIDELAEKAAELTSAERRELINLLQEQERKDEQNNSLSISSVSVKFESNKKANPNIEWLKANRVEYAGNYVALKEGILLGFGKTIKEADLKAKEKGVKNPLLHYIPAEDEEVWGGW